MAISLVKRDGTVKKMRTKDVSLEGSGKVKVSSEPGDIIALTGIRKELKLAIRLPIFENPEAMPTISIEEPTMSMLFTINNSPFFGKEGKFVTSRHLRDRLYKELEKNLALKVEPTVSPDAFLVFGRGILHLSVLIETMRREGYELQVGQPKVIIKIINGKKCEPIEELTIMCRKLYWKKSSNGESAQRRTQIHVAKRRYAAWYLKFLQRFDRIQK